MKWLVVNCTNACNFKCKTCLREYGRSSNVPITVLEKAIHDAKKLGYSGVSFTGGEPCLHPEFRAMVELFIKERFMIGFVSNGSLPQKYSFLYEEYGKNLSFAAFSIDGATSDVHDDVRENGSFEKTKNTITQFINSGVFTKMVVCINKLNKHQIEGIVRLGLDLNVKAINFTAVIETYENKNLLLSEIEKMEAINSIGRLRKKYVIELNMASSLQASNGVDFCRALNELTDITINPKGEVVLCCDTVRDGAVIGSLENESFLQLYCKALDKIAEIKKIRAIVLAKSTQTHNFNTCEFCNKYLDKDIARYTSNTPAAENCFIS